ncbi:MAG: hypothetical protein Q9160_001886 [Pyrenula sp. 1 TL-2023]
MTEILETRKKSPSLDSAIASERDIELGSTREPPKLHLKDREWSMVHSFYVVMGGFVVDITELPDNEKFFPLSRKRLTLTPETLLFLAEHEPSLLDIPSEADLRDKSKANGITEMIVCLQATWFLAQFISRLSQGLAASLLELNTAAHALCALLIYCLWWSKPLDIDEPTMIPGKNSKELFAVLCFFWRFGRLELPLVDKLVRGTVFNESSRDCDQFAPKSKNNRELDLGKRSSHYNEHPSDLEERTTDQEIPEPRNSFSENTPTKLASHCQTHVMPMQPTALKITSGEAIGRVIFRQARYSPYRQQEDYTYFTIHDYNRWNLASDGWHKYSTKVEERFRWNEPLRHRMGNWPALDMLDAFYGALPDVWTGDPDFHDPQLQIFPAFTVAGLVYGAIHLLAWEGPFHSHVERLLWRISAIAIAASGLLALEHALAETISLGFGVEKILAILDPSVIGKHNVKGQKFTLPALELGITLFPPLETPPSRSLVTLSQRMRHGRGAELRKASIAALIIFPTSTLPASFPSNPQLKRPSSKTYPTAYILVQLSTKLPNPV